MSEHYFRFPLAALGSRPTPVECLDMALNCAMYSAGRGLSENDPDQFAEVLERQNDRYDINVDEDDTAAAFPLVGVVL